MKVTKKRKILSKKLVVIAICSLIVICVAALFLFLIIPKPSSKTSTTPTNSSATQSSSGTTSTKGSGVTKPATLDTGVTPVEPSGTFVSNHHPNLSGSPAPSTESSTCTTTPGATCTIRFTKVNIVKSLEPKITNSDGNTNWDWALTDVGLTEGSWNITALATNGNKTATATDSMLLVVGQ